MAEIKPVLATAALSLEEDEISLGCDDGTLDRLNDGE